MDIENPVTEVEFIEQAGEVLPKTYAHFDFVIDDMPDFLANSLMAIIDHFVESHNLTKGGGWLPTTDKDYHYAEVSDVKPA
jgi:hypothetical protein